MKNSLISLNIYDIPFRTLASNAQTIHNGFADNAAEYSNPKPALSLFQSHINALKKLIAKWGIKGNRGSHKTYVKLLNAVLVVQNDLRMLSNYAQNKKPNDRSSWQKLGFTLKLDKSASQQLQAVQNFRHFISRSVPAPAIKLRWKKPLASGRRNVKGYLVIHNTTGVLPVDLSKGRCEAILAVVTDTFFIDEHPPKGENWYWIIPVGTAGLGAVSQAVMVFSKG